MFDVLQYTQATEVALGLMKLTSCLERALGDVSTRMRSVSQIWLYNMEMSSWIYLHIERSEVTVYCSSTLIAHMNFELDRDSFLDLFELVETCVGLLH